MAGSLKAGWTLTSEGNVWLKKNQTRLSEFDKQGFEGNRIQNAGDAKAELRRIKAHPAFQDYASGQRGCPSRRAIAEILRCTAGSKQSAFRASLERFLAYAEDDDPAVLEFLIFMKNSSLGFSVRMNNSQEFTLFHYHLGPQAARDRAAQFMSGDVHRGIVELLTNSDTAYSTMKEISRNRRPIEVRISRSSSHRWFEVRDKAGGMNSETLRDKFTQGGATSTAGERGYFGLGAKDCAVFGKMTVETVDQSGNLNKVELSRNYIDNKIYKSRKATPEDYARLLVEIVRQLAL